MIKNMNNQSDEVLRREMALAELGGEIEGVARPIAGREIMQMVSVRFEPELIIALREIAEQRGQKVSDLLREAASNLVSQNRTRTVSMRTYTNPATFFIKPQIALKCDYSVGENGELLGSTSSFRSA